MAHDGQWSFTLSAPNQEDYVAYTISVYGIDRAGNRATQPTQGTFIVDNVAPVLTVTQLINTAPLTYSLPVLNIAATDGGGLAQALVFVEAPNTTFLPIVAYNYVNRPYATFLPVVTRNYAAGPALQ